jgi:hypothetical protein
MLSLGSFFSGFNREPRRRLRAVETVTVQADTPWKVEERAQALLRSWLSPDQRSQYDACGHFEVVGCDTGKRYRVYRGGAFNVQELDAQGLETRSWCFTAEGVPVGDTNLAQKIALENFENQALRIANRSSASTWQSVQRPSEPRSWMQWY